MSDFEIAFLFVVLIILCLANLAFIGMTDLKVRHLEKSMNLMWPIVTKLDFEFEQGETPERREVVFETIGSLGAPDSLAGRVAHLEVVVDQSGKFQRAHYLALNVISRYLELDIWGLTKGNRK